MSPLTIFMVPLILAAGGGFIWLVHRRYSDGNPPPGTTRGQRAGNWLTALRLALSKWAALALAWLREMWQRWLRWRDRKAVPASQAPPAPSAPAPQRPQGPARQAPAGGPIPLDVTPAEIPPAFGPALAYISGFEPEEDADLMAFVRGVAAGDLAMADCYRQVLDHCLSELGLDPVSVQGLADYADERADSAHSAIQIWQRFGAVYREVQEWVGSGGVLPKDGRWLTGESS